MRQITPGNRRSTVLGILPFFHSKKHNVPGEELLTILGSYWPSPLTSFANRFTARYGNNGQVQHDADDADHCRVPVRRTVAGTP